MGDDRVARIVITLLGTAVIGLGAGVAQAQSFVVSSTTGAVGNKARISVTLQTGGANVYSGQVDITYDPTVVFLPSGSACSVNPAINKTNTSFSLQAPRLRALIFDVGKHNQDLIPDGSVLFTCTFDLLDEGVSTLGVSNGLLVALPDVTEIPATGVNGSIRVLTASAFIGPGDQTLTLGDEQGEFVFRATGLANNVSAFGFDIGYDADDPYEPVADPSGEVVCTVENDLTTINFAVGSFSAAMGRFRVLFADFEAPITNFPRDGVIARCPVRLRPGAIAGVYELPCVRVDVSNSNGDVVGASCEPGSLTVVEPPSPTPTLTETPPFTPTPTATRTPIAPRDFAYIVRFGNPDAVRVVDTRTNTLSAAEIELSLGGQFVAVAPNGRLAYVSGVSGVTVIDTEMGAIVNELSVFAPSGIDSPVGRVAFHPDGTAAYVVNGDPPALSVIDTATHEVSDTINLDGAIGNGDPGGIGVTPAGVVYVTPLLLGSDTSIAVVDVAEREVVSRIPVPCDLAISQDVAVAPDGARVYVPLFGCEPTGAGSGGGTLPPCIGDCDGDDTVTLSEVVLGVNVALGASDLDACPDLSQGTGAVTVYSLIGAVAANLNGCAPVVQEIDGNGLAVIGTARNQVLTTISFGRAGTGGGLEPRGVQPTNGNGIDLTPDGRFAYVAGCDIPNLICVVDTRSNTLSTRIAAFDSGQVAFDIAITPDGRLAYVTQSTRSQVAVIDLRTNATTPALFVPENRGVATGRRAP